jgi:hypothetical protein
MTIDLQNRGVEDGGVSGVSSFNGRSGSVTSQESDYSAFYRVKVDNVIPVKDPSDLSGTLDSTKVYEIDGIIDFTGTGLNIEIPAGGLNLRGYSFDVSKLICSDASFDLFTSPVGGSGNLVGTDFALEMTGGVNCRVFNLSPVDNFRAIEFNRINYNDCTNLGVIDAYRQGFESGCGRFGGTPNLTLSGAWGGGWFIASCIVRALDAGMSGALYQAGAGFVMSSRFRSNMNVDLPASASYFDFAPSNFPNPSTVQMVDGIVTRDGVQDANDANLTPNMLASDICSQWVDNVGLDNTYVGGRVTNTLEIETVISVQGDYYDINGASLPAQLEHFDSPAAFQLRHLGNNPRDYTVYIDANVDGQQNAELALKVVRWDDSASSFVDVFTQRRPVNNLLGGRDVAIFNIQTPIQLDQNDYVKWQIANLTGTQNVTLELDSYMVVSER